MRQIFIITLLLLCSLTHAVQGLAGPYHIDLHTDPELLAVGRAKLIIRLTDGQGKPVTGAKITALAQMPGMAMGEREETVVDSDTPGTYRVPAVFGMAGAYEASISINGPLGNAQTTLKLATGQSTESSPGPILWPYVLGILVGVVAFILLIRQARIVKSMDFSKIFTGRVLFSVLLLGGTFAIVVWVVNTQRRPGSMTPIEAQVMDMNAPAPESALPVRLAKAERRSFVETVTYAGQAVGFTEQDVVARVAGQILEMPVYVGSKVTSGQLLVRLDTHEVDQAVSEKSAALTMAVQGVGVANQEYQQALSQVTQARAELSAAKSEVEESRAMLQASQQSIGSSQAALDSANSDVRSARAEETSAEADLSYQQGEFERMRSLFAQGAISKDEWQRANADLARSRASRDKAKEAIWKMKSAVSAAKSDQRKVAAEIIATRKKVQQTEAGVRAKSAAVQSALAFAEATKAKINQSRSGVNQSSAMLRGAATQKSHAEILGNLSGIVTQRMVSPGTYVTPGQVLLKVAQVDPIRLQANVPEADLSRIEVGAIVRVTGRAVAGKSVTAKVTSVSPSVDASSRSGIVEAILPNGQGRFQPGQSLTLEISISNSESSVVLPDRAIQVSDDKNYVWIAEPAGINEFTVSRREVIVGGSSAGSIEIKSGLTADQSVVLDPPQGLSENTRVTSIEDPKPVTQDQVIEITAAGYSPPSISIPANKAFRVTFIRRDDKTCGTEVIFPSLGIRRTLPLNKPVVIEIPPQSMGKQLAFTCPMNMLNGKAVAK